jgi:hypothetical protein
MISNNNCFLKSDIFYLQTNKVLKAGGNSTQSVESSTAFASVPLGAYNDRLFQTKFSSLPKTIKGSSPEVARQLKSLSGTLDQKLAQAKDIILKDLGLNPDLLKLVDEDCGPRIYAMSSPARGIIKFNKALCKQPHSQFSDDAVLCILRHELDHMIVFTKIYKTLGPEKFENFIQNNDYLKTLPSAERIVNHEFYKEMSKSVDVSNFDAKPYIDAFDNYNKGVDNTGINYSNFRLFTMITKNFDNELENSARNVQYALEEQMGVTTLKDFYSMIDHTKILKSNLSDFLSKNPSLKDGNDTEEILFDYLYHKSATETGLEDKTQNWGKILTHAESKVSSISKNDIEEARKYRAKKIASSKSS